MIAHTIGETLRNRAIAEGMQVEHGDHARKGADGEIAELVDGWEREGLLCGVEVGRSGERRDQIAEELESVRLAVDVGDLVGDVIVENVQKTFENYKTKGNKILAIITQITPYNGWEVSMSFKSFSEL